MSDLQKQLRDHYRAQALSAEKAESILAHGRAAASGEEAPASPPLEGISPSMPEREASSGSQPPAPGKVTEFPIQHSLILRRMLPLAAAVLLFASLAGWWERRETAKVPFTALAPRVIEFFGSQPELAKAPQSKAELRSWLLARGAPSDFQIPAPLMPLESFACSVVDVGGRKTYLSCYWRENKPARGDHELIHLLVGRRSDFQNAPPSTKPERRELNGWSFASWSEADVIYTLATAAPPEKLTPFLAQIARVHSVHSVHLFALAD